MSSSTDTRTTPSSAPAEGQARLALVIPWVGDDAHGGAELQGWETARELAARGWAVEVLTTCSRSFLHRWDENYHRPGEELREGVPVRRFPVDRRDEGRFGAANQALLAGGRLSPTQEDDFVRESINSRELYRFIRERGDEYVFIFLPYLYGTTLIGASVRPDRSLLMPCFHDEPYAYLEVTRRRFGEVRGMLYLTTEEARAVDRVMGRSIPGMVTGGGIDVGPAGSGERFRSATGIADPFLLYVGRLDRGKNTHLLMAYFRRWLARNEGSMKLVLIGGGDLPVPADEPAFVRLGVTDEGGKRDACAAALALCQPSVNESFSRVIMEAWLQGTPVLVSGRCEVTRGHCLRSAGGLFFDDWYEFAEEMDLLAADEGLRRGLGEAGRRYVQANYRWDTVIARLLDAVTSLTGLRPARAGGLA